VYANHFEACYDIKKNNCFCGDIIIIIDLSVTCYQLLNYLPIFKGTLFESSLQNVARQSWVSLNAYGV